MLASTGYRCCSSGACDSSPLAVVTGGTGTVGSALVQQLGRALPDRDILVLTRRPERARAQNVAALYADLERPDLAMDEDLRSELRKRTTLIVHCAADTRFNLPIEQARLTNAQGTRHILNLALECPRLTQFAHISTLFVAGQREGPVTEKPLRHEAGYVNTYERAKHEAEELVLAASGRLPVGIYRLSSVIDESGTGGHFRQVIRFVPWCAQFPFFPADSGVPVDLVACGWPARALSVLIAEHFEPGCIRHICAGGEEAMSVGAAMDLVFSAYEASGESLVSRPRLISLSDFQIVSERLPPGGASRAMASLMTFIPHLSISQPFDCGTTAKLLASSGVPRPDMRSLLSRVLKDEFCPAEARS